MSHEKFSLSLSPAPYHTLASCGAKELTPEANVFCCSLVSLRGTIFACSQASSRFAAAACWLAIDAALFASAIDSFASAWYLVSASSLSLPAFHENVQPSNVTRAKIPARITAVTPKKSAHPDHHSSGFTSAMVVSTYLRFEETVFRLFRLLTGSGSRWKEIMSSALPKP